jgi:hypothetical protein
MSTTAESTNVSEYTKGQRYSILISAMLGYILDFYDVLIFPFLLPAIQKSMSISLTQAGTLQALTLFGSAVGGAFVWYDRRPVRAQDVLATYDRAVVSRSYPVGLRVEFLVAGVAAVGDGHRTRGRVRRRHGTVQRGLAQAQPRAGYFGSSGLRRHRIVYGIDRGNLADLQACGWTKCTFYIEMACSRAWG